MTLRVFEVSAQGTVLTDPSGFRRKSINTQHIMRKQQGLQNGLLIPRKSRPWLLSFYIQPVLGPPFHPPHGEAQLVFSVSLTFGNCVKHRLENVTLFHTFFHYFI